MVMDINIRNFEQTIKSNYNLPDEIPLLDTNLSYNEFFENYLLPNLPCRIKNIAINWNSTKLWIENQKPNFKYLREAYGKCNVTVYKCFERHFNSQKTENVEFENYLNYWQKCASNKQCLEIKYLKDWHLKNNFRTDSFYEVPIYFSSDWLNEYFTECLEDDYRFVYMGPKNSWTPFHADVFASYSWTVNVCGKKRWILFPPGEETFLLDELQNLPYDVTKINHNRKYYEFEQNEGEAFFVPSSWHHEVFNLDDTISINHNWVNGCNIEIMCSALETNLMAVKKEISDCEDMDDFDEHCQLMLNCSFGMNYYKFYEFLKYICEKRIKMVSDTNLRKLYNGHLMSMNHILFDISSIKNVFEKFMSFNTIVKLKYFNKIKDEHNNLMETIVKVLE